MAPTKYHKFRSGERCDECGARQWYAQDALRYCRNGHRLEGFAEHEGDEDNFGTQGRVTRKKKEKRKKIAVKLSGDEGRELYLEVLQLILLRQVRWLIGKKAFPADFEEIVRALWALRVRSLPVRGGENDDGEREESQPVFSSMGEGSGDESEESDARRRWKLPRLVDTLALCYLGCLVRRLPASTADFCSWAQRGEIDFLAAFNDIPRNVRDRLPAEYHRALQVRDHIPPGRLQAAVRELVISYKVNFETVFPPLNYVPILVRFITDLTLPAEVYMTVKCMTEIFKANYSYPTGGKRIQTMDNPEVLLISLVAVSVKLLYPLDGIERPPRSHEDPRSLKVNWAKWQEVMQDDTTETSSNLRRGEEYKVTSDDVLTMDKEKLDDFMDWFENMWIGDGDAKTDERIREPFENQKRPSKPNTLNQRLNTGRDGERIRNRYEALNSSLQVLEPVPDPEDLENGNKEKQDRDFCPVWRTEEDLPDAAKVFYQKAANIAAIPLDTLMKGTAQVENRLAAWCNQRMKRERDKGKGKAILMGDDSA
ncbi:uncharacterized protein GGS22DRAFT_152167 [Annulohypoxylon maeteangense]|uniref:uncharacterized protein n=1 Tax=Annulohypoxylon maeteangense TaxID=1927788 RepID=UPI0020088642|nr:uncharacterized protein GGS22DRAFT_152167 [Annulohypoxylon maeteangense]KAI0888684.1 hypothetical protein GGS22DRAFT_152167 [Annulohypoxylon maeteangense]